jgi:hypothetical protein
VFVAEISIIKKPSTSVVAPLAAPIVQFSPLQLKRIPAATLSGVLKLAGL